MAIAIREYLGYEGFEVQWDVQNPKAGTINLTEANLESVSPESLMVDIEGIHVGPTRNFTWYTEEALRGSIPSWTKPYLRPLIMHHNEKDGKIIGRIRFVTYTSVNTRSGTGALIFTANVPDKDGIEQIQDGRLKTVSIGVIVHDCRCSICGQNIADEGPCEHERGQKYDEKTCFWLIYAMEAKELSYVIVPSDIYAHNTKIYKPSGTDMNMAANYESKGVLNVSEATKIDPVTGLPVVEGQTINEEGELTPEAEIPAEETPAEDEAPDELEALKAELETAKADIAVLEEKIAISGTELERVSALLDVAQKSLKTTSDTLTAKEAALNTEVTLRESLETKMIELNTEAKANLIENVMILRTSLGKPVMLKEDLEKRSEDSLKDAVLDLKEELSNPVNAVQITHVENPSLVENEEEGGPDVKDDKKAGNIDLVEGLESIFNTLMGSKSAIYQ